MRVAEAAIAVLTQEQKALRIEELIIKMQALGWECKGRSPKSIASASLYDFIHRQNESSPIVCLGNQTFVLKELAILAKPIDPKKVSDGERSLFYSLPVEARHCANCMHFDVTAVKQYNKESGYCTLPIGAKCRYTRAEWTCPKWQPRSEGQINQDTKERDELHIFLAEGGYIPYGESTDGRPQPKARATRKTVKK